MEKVRKSAWCPSHHTNQHNTHKLRLLLRCLIKAAQRILQAGRQSPEILVVGLPRRHGCVATGIATEEKKEI
jgi:hypothetical protein